jgi:nitrogen fixation protein NifU and related proteins
MGDLRDLYQEVILDHNKHPRNYGPLTGANRNAHGQNPLCGDQIAVHLKVEDGVVRDVHFEGSGCAIVTASASLMTEILKGKTVDEAHVLFDQMIGLLTGDPSRAAEVSPELGKLEVFAGVREYPMRVKCATLAWHTLHAALLEKSSAVSTE